ncbi:UNVERIFIED_CONTAM: hypothetical protein K2H54_047251, partial [Gekko kuhli]
SPRAAVFLILFGLVTLLIIYSSNSRSEDFHYTSSGGKFPLPSNLKEWGVKNGYLPVTGNKVTEALGVAVASRSPNELERDAVDPEGPDSATATVQEGRQRWWLVLCHGGPGGQQKTLDRHCNQCAIITSSSHLLGSKLGPEIDRTECTIRMNDAPTTGYEPDVGNKTTFRVVAHSSLYRVLKRPQEFVNKTPDTILIFWGPPVRMQQVFNKVIQRVGMSFPNMSAFVTSSKRMSQFDNLFRKETGKDR